jgi:hypothetical protein
MLVKGASLGRHDLGAVAAVLSALHGREDFPQGLEALLELGLAEVLAPAPALALFDFPALSARQAHVDWVLIRNRRHPGMFHMEHSKQV